MGEQGGGGARRAESKTRHRETALAPGSMHRVSYLMVPVGEGRGLIMFLKSVSGMLIFRGEIWG